MVHQASNRRERRAEKWKNLAQVQTEAAKRQPVRKPIGRPPLAIFAAVAVAIVLIGGGAYLALSPGAPAVSTVRHVPSK